LRLLFDENLAPRLAQLVAGLFPGSLHVSSVELSSAPDAAIWEYAKANDLAFVTKDKDFAGLSMVRGAPPKVVLVQTGNSSTALIENVLRSNAIRISEFERDLKRSLLILK
jgi:predicted nuclease of predicted toxin-antitoxin system